MPGNGGWAMQLKTVEHHLGPRKLVSKQKLAISGWVDVA